MADRRRYTGSTRLQLGWTALVVLAVAVLAAVAPGLFVVAGSSAAGYGLAGVVWLVGLLGIGFADRRHWRSLVAASEFDPQRDIASADLQRMVRGHSVTVETYVPSVLGQSHTRIGATVEGVDASFTVDLRYVEAGGTDRGLTTGNDHLDDRFVIEGSPGNVKRVLSPDVQAALMDLETPGTIRVTGDRVVYDVPFTRLGPDELRACASAVVELVERLEALGRGTATPVD